MYAHLMIAMVALGGDPATGGELRVESALVTLIEHVDVPAKEAGVLMEIAVREGEAVTTEATLAQIDDHQANLAVRKAEAELDIARRQADNELKYLFATKSAEVARAELKRSKESVEKYSKSVSQTELDRLKLLVEQSELEAQQAKHDQAVARLTATQKEVELESARHNVERRRIAAPIDGIVVEVKRQLGEWVEPGMAVARVVRMDRLRVEGFIPAREAASDLTGRPVKLVADLPGHPSAEFAGKIVFVSPEINPVNGQVRVWAEVENRDQLLRPGLKPVLVIQPAEKKEPVAKKESAEKKE